MIEGIEEYEAELLANGRAQIAREDAAWNALPQSEKNRINAEREILIGQMFEEVEDEDPEEDGEEEGE